MNCGRGLFVLRKACKRWIWIALSRSTRQVVAYAIGDRGEATCRKLWEAIPEAYCDAHCYSDFWQAYSAVIPWGRHTRGQHPVRADGTRRTLQQHAAATSRALSSWHFVVLEVSADA